MVFSIIASRCGEGRGEQRRGSWLPDVLRRRARLKEDDVANTTVAGQLSTPEVRLLSCMLFV